LAEPIEIPEEYRPEIDHLPGDLARIAEMIEEHWPSMGVVLTLFLAQVFRGQNLYFRNIDYLIRQIRDDAIRKEYNEGHKVREIALKWRLSKRWVEDILSRPGKMDQDESAERQLNLF